jgi:myo-inositol 2-dehydrogenase/D-chiro-inositol 1-dehydrogenase
LRVAVLGTGRMGGLRARLLAAHPDVELVLVGGSDRRRAERLAHEVGGRAGTVDEVLDAAPDAAVVSSATDRHLRDVEACAARGLPILCEKPIALTVEESARALERVEAAGVLLQVGFHRRFDPGFRRAHELARAGALGTLYGLRLSSYDHEPSPERFIPGSGGIFRDLGIHDFDSARFLTGLEVEEVHATGSARVWERYGRHGDLDTFAALLVLEGGLVASTAGTRHNVPGYDVRAELVGSEDSIVVGLDSRSPLHSVEPDAPPEPRDPYRDFTARFGTAFRDETAAFLDAARGRRENPCPGENALAALRIAIACERSRAEGRPVPVP